eukprot:351296-Chlamydomonas_euryale.AAC.1
MPSTRSTPPAPTPRTAFAQHAINARYATSPNPPHCFCSACHQREVRHQPQPPALLLLSMPSTRGTPPARHQHPSTPSTLFECHAYSPEVVGVCICADVNADVGADVVLAETLKWLAFAFVPMSTLMLSLTLCWRKH